MVDKVDKYRIWRCDDGELQDCRSCQGTALKILRNHFQGFTKGQAEVASGDVPTFFNYAIADGLYNLLFPDKTGIKKIQKTKFPDFQLCLSFLDEPG